MIIVNTPNNPTASVFSGEDMRMLEGLLRGTDIVVVSDEVYEHIVFDGHAHESVARYPGSPSAASSSRRSARPITSRAGRWATCSRRRS